MRKMTGAFFVGVLALLSAAPGAFAQGIHEREIRIPWALAGSNGLDALLVYAESPGKHPLVVMTHESKFRGRRRSTPR